MSSLINPVPGRLGASPGLHYGWMDGRMDRWIDGSVQSKKQCILDISRKLLDFFLLFRVPLEEVERHFCQN